MELVERCGRCEGSGKCRYCENGINIVKKEGGWLDHIDCVHCTFKKAGQCSNCQGKGEIPRKPEKTEREKEFARLRASKSDIPHSISR